MFNIEINIVYKPLTRNITMKKKGKIPKGKPITRREIEQKLQEHWDNNSKLYSHNINFIKKYGNGKQ